MEMKPEHNHGSYTITDIRLLHKNMGDSAARVFRLCREFVPDAYADMTYAEFLAEEPSSTKLLWRLMDKADIEYVKNRLLWAGVQPEICERTIYYLSPDNEYRYIPNFKLGEWDLPIGRIGTEDLNEIQEYAFDKWAEANALAEAYRCWLFPALGDSETIRVWKKNNDIFLVHKKGQYGLFCTQAPKYEKNMFMSETKWQELEEFMAAHFWSDNSWSSNHGLNFLDGYSLTFEGWKNGQYKKLADENPHPRDVVSIRAYKLFAELPVE